MKRETKVISFVVFQLPWETFIGREVSSIRALSGMEKKMVRRHGLFAFVKWLLSTYVSNISILNAVKIKNKKFPKE